MSNDDIGYTEAIECRHSGNQGPIKISARFNNVREFDDGFNHWDAGKILELARCMDDLG